MPRRYRRCIRIIIYDDFSVNKTIVCRHIRRVIGGYGDAQHFLLSAAARTLSLAQVARLSDEEAHAKFCELRWHDNDGKPYCPHCGGFDIYRYEVRRIFKCKACRRQFSATSGTLFHSRKLSHRDYLLAIAIFVNGAKGHAALQLSRDLNVQYKTAFVLSHKLREALGSEVHDPVAPKLSGEVHIDDLYTGGHVRPANKKEDRTDRRFADAQSGKSQVVVVARERYGRTKPFVVAKESDGVLLIRQAVASGSIIHADEAAGWDVLLASFDMRRVNHSREFKSEDGGCTNEAESFFSRLRRSQYGIHHRIAGPYLHQYANEMAWREDNRRVPNGMQWKWIGRTALRLPKSAAWCGYRQRSMAA